MHRYTYITDMNEIFYGIWDDHSTRLMVKGFYLEYIDLKDNY